MAQVDDRDSVPDLGRPSLVFELATIAANMRRVADAAHACGIRALFAAKSFAHADVRALAAEILDGFDVASVGELEVVEHGKIVSVADPTGAAIAAARGQRVIVSCENEQQVAAAPDGAEIAIRISASLTRRDPAVGAILDGSGHRRSRFGLEHRDEIARVGAAARGRRVGIHVHHGPVTATAAERFIASARAALAVLDFEPAFIDLGGAWHGIADLGAAFADIRAAIPASIEILVEPGRLYAQGAGFATGHVTTVRDAGERVVCVADLSRVCHLRWSQIELVTEPPHPHDVLVVGPTCFEEDVLGEWWMQRPRAGDRLVFRNVSGYALGWNTGFGGVPPADVVMLR
jgi:diaminopimelate decarboxylase